MSNVTELAIRRMRVIATAVFSFCLASSYAGRVPAFPEAEGYGSYAQGGRGGIVLAVTNVLDYEPGEPAIPGSLRAAIETKGPRTITFLTSGLIALKSPLAVTHPFVTIAGQTAPGEGICVKNFPFIVRGTHDVIIRYLRVRTGEDAHEELDGIGTDDSENVIFDHCSASWSTDEVFSPEGRNLTVQWCIVSEGLDRSFHPKGKHSKGSIIRGTDGGVTFHHNLYAHNADRNPKMESFPNRPGLLLDFRNNVIYDWGYQSGYSGRDYGHLNYVGNFLKPGKSTSKGAHFAFRPGSDRTKVFVRENIFEGDTAGTKDNDLLIKWDGKSLDEVRVGEVFPSPPVKTHMAAEAFQQVLANAGATLPRRDRIDARLMADVAAGKGTIINSQNDVGSWPEYKSVAGPQDSDGDGMPDEWERANKLNPQQASNNADSDGDGYTDLEEYLNGTNPQKRDATPDAKKFDSILAKVTDLQKRALPQIKTVANTEARVEAERKPLKLSVKMTAVTNASPKRVEIAAENAPALPMVLIPAGSFIMGSPESEALRKDDEVQHKVTITKPYYLGVYTVTRRQFAAVMKTKMPSGKDGDLPVIAVWNEAVWFCKNLSHATGRTFRLPTEAEWEYACRAGTTTPFSTGETISTEQANFNGDRTYGNGARGVYRDSLTPPGTFPPNAWGVCDMHGNFFQWCSDWRAPYPKGDQVDPQGPANGRRRAMRGGNFSSHPTYLRSAFRYDYDPKVEYGFRVVMEAE